MKDFPTAAWPVLALAATLLAACGDRTPDATADDAAQAPGAPAAALPPRPDTIRSSIPLEGTEEPMTFWLFRSPPEFPVPFTTYVPEDMAAAPVVSEAGDAIRFVAEFGGVRNENAFLAVAFAPANVDEAGARALARMAAQRYGAQIRPRAPGAPPRYAWSIEEWDFTRQLPGGTAVIGTAALGRHGDRYFFLATHFPEEYAEGFGPRAARILAEWRWEDTGEPLGGATAAQ